MGKVSDSHFRSPVRLDADQRPVREPCTHFARSQYAFWRHPEAFWRHPEAPRGTQRHPTGCTASGNPLCVVSYRVGGVWKPQRLGNEEAVGSGGDAGGVAVAEGRAMVQGGTGDELTTCATQTDGRPIDVMRGSSVQARPSCAMRLTKRPFPGLLTASLLRCAQPRSPRSEVFRPPMTRARRRRHREVQPWRPAAQHNLEDAWEPSSSPKGRPRGTNQHAPVDRGLPQAHRDEL